MPSHITTPFVAILSVCKVADEVTMVQTGKDFAGRSLSEYTSKGSSLSFKIEALCKFLAFVSLSTKIILKGSENLHIIFERIQQDLASFRGDRLQNCV